MGKIKLLSAQLVSKIAAGEVVERPVSIVKELVENAVDAGSSEIIIRISGDTLGSIEVSDDGSGIDKEDLQTAVMLHATSKLSSIDDLYNLSTLGFRGEALASIAAVSDLEITSAIGGAANAWKLKEDGAINAASRQRGTTVTATNIFRKLPARRKFLKSVRTEEKLCRDLIKKMAISHPAVAFSYFVEGKLVLEYQRSSSIERISQVMNIPQLEMVFIDNDNIQAAVALPKHAARKPFQIITINGRLVKSNIVSAAVKQAFSTNIPPELNPTFYVNLVIDPAAVDVNIHPRKEEVKFSDEGLVFSIVYKAVNEELQKFLSKQLTDRLTQAGNSESEEGYQNVYYDSKNSYDDGLSNQERVDRPVAGQLNTKPAGSLHDYGSVGALSKGSSYNVSQGQQMNYHLEVEKTQLISKFLQLENKYLIAVRSGELLIIDQHAAAERVNYEKFMKRIIGQKKIAAVPLLVPIILKLAASGTEQAEIVELFEKFGMELELIVEDETQYEFAVKTIPEVLVGNPRLKEIIEGIQQDLNSDDEFKTNFAKRSMELVCATLACHSSIRAGDPISDLQFNQLVSDLMSCREPYACPHGRPTIRTFSLVELDKYFLRRK